MTPFYWASHHGNFGDDLNLWLWDFLLPGFRETHPDVTLVGVGTVLNRDLLPRSGRKLVIGSGCGYGEPPDLSNWAEWDIRALRGPLSARELRFDPWLGIVDPAVLVADMPEFQSVAKTGGTVFVPHWESTVGGLWPDLCRLAGIGYIDPCGEAKSVIRMIAAADLVIAESMHAAILADAFRVPWVAVTTSDAINSFKWNDFVQSLGLVYAPRRIPLSSRAEAITKGARFWGVDFAARPRMEEMDDKAAAHPEADGETMLAEAKPSALEKTPAGLRGLTKQMLGGPAALALWRAARAEPQLSTEARLAQRKQRLYDVLASVRADYL